MRNLLIIASTPPVASFTSHIAAILVGVGLTAFMGGRPAFAQNVSHADVPLHERDPFDRVTLDKENKSAQVDVFPIDSVDRTQRPGPDIGPLVIRRVQDPPNVMFSVSGEHIVKLELFPLMLLDEMRRRVSAGDTDGAFQYIARLKNEFPDTQELDEVIEEFFFADAKHLFINNRFDEALLALDQVFHVNPNRPRLSLVLDRTLSRIITAEFDAKNYESVRQKLDYAKRKYGKITKTTVETWEGRIQAEAKRDLRLAQQAFGEGDPTTALAAVRRARKTWPGLSGIDELDKAILAQYPRVRVGVTQPFQTTKDPTALVLNWAARRVTPLVANSLVTFKDFTADGGQYESRIGTLEITPNREQVSVLLRPEFASEIYPLSRALLQLADPKNATYSPRWAEFLKSVYVPASNKIEINITRPTMRPEGLVPRTLPDSSAGLLGGDFVQLKDKSTEFQTFQVKASRPSDTVREIAEHHFADPSRATAALLSREVDVIDRVYPPDLKQLKNQSNVRVIPYRLPTIHALVFNDREPILRSSTFRRGLLYGINRAGFVRDELIAGGSDATAQVISGFAPVGQSANDPLGYAYDSRIQPRDHDPALGLVLLRLAMARRDELISTLSPSQDTNIDHDEPTAQETAVELPSLVLAYPEGPVANAASGSIGADLRRLGIDITLRPLASGRGWPADGDWDVLYIETTIEEPFVDIPNLILGNSILGRHGGLVLQATRALQEATDLEQIRNRLRRIHKLTFDHTPMLPLWQVIEHVAISSNVQGVSSAPISMYHDVSEWRLGQ